MGQRIDPGPGRSLRDIALTQLDRIAHPDTKLDAPITNHVELTYADGSIIRGKLRQADSKRVIRATSFTETPVTSTLTGAATLSLNSPAPEGDVPATPSAQLITAVGKLSGHLTFDPPEAPLAWRPIGGTESLRIATKSQARIERSKGSFEEDIPYDPETYPDILPSQERRDHPMPSHSIQRNHSRLPIAVSNKQPDPVRACQSHRI